MRRGANTIKLVKDMKNVITGIILLLFLINANAQSRNGSLNEPEVGKLCPDLIFNKIDFYKSKKLSLSDLRGKWVVLDFWSRFCSGCIGSFPKISEEQEQFGDSVQFIMIAPDSTTGEQALYANYHKKLNLKMPSAFDAELFHRFNVALLPHTIIIDPSGIVRVITTAQDAVKLKELINGGQPIFSEASYTNKKEQVEKTKYNRNVPYLEDGNGGSDTSILFRSLLAQWKPHDPEFNGRSLLYSTKYLKNGGRFEAIGQPLTVLYLAAYSGRTLIGMDDSILYGKLFPNPIFEIKDTSALVYDYATGKNLYGYSLIVPPNRARENYMMQIMQNDLKNYFGYDVVVETRKMPYWRLVATKEAKVKIKTKGGPFVISNNGKPYQENSLRNCPMNRFLKLVDFYSGVTSNYSPPLLDETGIDFNIDIDLKWLKGDYMTVRKALQKNGLDLVPGEKEMKCIIVKDSKTGEKQLTIK